MIQTSEFVEPKITIKRDSQTPQFPKDVQVSIKELPNEIEKRNKKSMTPLTIIYQYKNCWNMTIIDTPGLPTRLGEESDADLDAYLSDLAKPTDNRILVFVEVCKDWTEAYMLQYAEKLDSKLSRSTFVYTQLGFHLHNISSGRDFGTFISGRPPPKVKSFFVSGLSTPVRQKSLNINTYLTRLQQSTQRDFQRLNDLKYENKYAFERIA